MPRPSPLDAVLAAAARLQARAPDAVCLGSPPVALRARRPKSYETVVADLRGRFDEVLSALEATDGWVTARIQRPVLVLGRLDGVDTGVRNLVRSRPLEVEEVSVAGKALRVPTLAEITRIKAWLCLMRNATRDYVDFAALADRMGDAAAAAVVASMDDWYEDQKGPGGRRVATQVARQLAEPVPGDLSDVDLATYRRLDRRWRDWRAVSDVCRRIAAIVLDRFAGAGP